MTIEEKMIAEMQIEVDAYSKDRHDPDFKDFAEWHWKEFEAYARLFHRVTGKKVNISNFKVVVMEED